MSWFHSSTAPVAARNHASPAEVVACFQDQGNILGRLAFLITGDHATADQAVVQACEITLQGNSPFRDWLFEWAKASLSPDLAMASRRDGRDDRRQAVLALAGSGQRGRVLDLLVQRRRNTTAAIKLMRKLLKHPRLHRNRQYRRRALSLAAALPDEVHCS